MANRKTANSLTLPCRYGNVNIGDKTASVGVVVSRAELTVHRADRQFCMKRLKVKLLARVNGAQATQQSLPGVDEDYVLKGTCDVAGFRAGGKSISMTLTFPLSAINVEEMSHLAKREGQLTVESSEEIEEVEAEEDADEAE